MMLMFVLLLLLELTASSEEPTVGRITCMQDAELYLNRSQTFILKVTLHQFRFQSACIDAASGFGSVSVWTKILSSSSHSLLYLNDFLKTNFTLNDFNSFQGLKSKRRFLQIIFSFWSSIFIFIVITLLFHHVDF